MRNYVRNKTYTFQLINQTDCFLVGYVYTDADACKCLRPCNETVYHAQVSYMNGWSTFTLQDMSRKYHNTAEFFS